MGADKSAANTPNAPKFVCQKIGISMKKGFMGRPWSVLIGTFTRMFGYFIRK
jgi:hypothetical protein